MSDFDFDELDKAVNSVIGQPSEEGSVEKSSESSADEGGNTPARNTTPSFALHSRVMASNRIDRSQQETSTSEQDLKNEEETSAPKVEEASHVSEPAITSQSSTDRQQYLPKRRTGRFMDVVHPSSDMRSSPKPLTSRRDGVSVQPASKPAAVIDPSFTNIIDPVENQNTPSQDFVSETSHETPEVTISEPAENNPGDNLPANSSLEAAINELLVSEGHEPVVDSVSSRSVKSDETPETPAPQPVIETSIPEPVKEETVFQSPDELEENPDELSMDEIFSDNQPQTSPFIEGAKVEKRPLGSSNLTTPQEDQNERATTAEDDLSAGPQDIGNEEILPEELNQDLMSIESLEAEVAAGEDVTAPPVTSSLETPAPAPQEADKPTEDTETDEPSKASDTRSYTGPTSIAQQYKLEPRENKDDETGDIFDTKTYHQPIKDDESKSSPLPWIIGAIVVVLLIAAGLVFAWWSGMLVVPM
jgi:hypothetical protein